jgi:hypothetical protein
MSEVHTWTGKGIGHDAQTHYMTHESLTGAEAHETAKADKAAAHAAEVRAVDEATPYHATDSEALSADEAKVAAIEATHEAEQKEAKLRGAAGTLAMRARVAHAESTIFANQNQGDLILDALETAKRPHVEGSQRGGSSRPINPGAYQKLIEENRNR